MTWAFSLEDAALCAATCNRRIIASIVDKGSRKNTDGRADGQTDGRKKRSKCMMESEWWERQKWRWWYLSSFEELSCMVSWTRFPCIVSAKPSASHKVVQQAEAAEPRSWCSVLVERRASFVEFKRLQESASRNSIEFASRENNRTTSRALPGSSYMDYLLLPVWHTVLLLPACETAPVL